MKVFASIAPLPEAIAKLDSKAIVASRLSSAEWEALQTPLRDRAFFSSKVEHGRWLSAAREKLLLSVRMQREAVARGEALVDRSSFIGDLRKAAFAAGIGTGKGDLQDVAGRARLKLIYDMQVQGAQGYARRQMDLDQDVLDAYPAQELVREEQRRAPRDWPALWQSKGGQLVSERMVALKTDGIWSRISRFGTPWPPFDFGSGMGLQDVSRSEAEDLGLIAPGDQVEPAADENFNSQLESQVNPNDTFLRDYLTREFGDQVKWDGGRVIWVGRTAA